MTVQDIYTRVTDAMLEPAGLVLGLVTYAQFAAYLADAVNDFLRLTGISKVFTTQTIAFGIRQYNSPDYQITIEQLFVRGRFLPQSTLDSINNSNYQWQKKLGVPKVWHTDNLPIKTAELDVNPNWQGAQYLPVLPPAYQVITPATRGSFGGTVDTAGVFVTWDSGDQFEYSNANWQGHTMYINGTPFVVLQVGSPTALQLATDAGVQAGATYQLTFPITLPATDSNLTFYGSAIPSSTGQYLLTDTIPLMPDSAAMYMAWGVLRKIYADDSELKDEQKAMYDRARFEEGVNVFRAAMLQLLGDDDEE